MSNQSLGGVNDQIEPVLESGRYPSRSSRLTIEQVKFLNDVKVPVSIELGELSLSAAQLIDLLPEQVFELAVNDELPVALKVSGEIIALAQLVALDSGLGVEIVRLFEPE